MKQPVVIIFLFSIFLISCNPNKIFEKYIDISNYKWDRELPVNFEVNIENVDYNYDVYIAVRHTVFYMYYDLLVSVTVLYPSGETRIKDHYLLLKDADGTFKGQGMGDIYDIEIPLAKNVKFPQSGTYIYKIQNIMPRPETTNIMQIGLVVKRSQK
jgi:gliding motility-associated lipoprotein GldH